MKFCSLSSIYTAGEDSNSPNCVALAPMAGITDAPFRNLCEEFGATWSCSEMLTSDIKLWQSNKSSKRLCFDSIKGRKIIQIAGNDPQQMALAAKVCAELGAESIDINMGCPVKKVARKACGSAILKDEKLVSNILHSVVNAVNLPVTLKFRTGWSLEQRNATSIAKIAESEGIAQLALHGRTRECAFKGKAEYSTIAEVVRTVNVPVIANGDIDNAQIAKKVLDITGCAGIMIGRGAQGKPWLFREIQHFLSTGEVYCFKNRLTCLKATVLQHLEAIYDFYGIESGVRIARKHFGWYAKQFSADGQVSKQFNTLDCHKQQLRHASNFLAFIDTELFEQHNVLANNALANNASTSRSVTNSLQFKGEATIVHTANIP